MFIGEYRPRSFACMGVCDFGGRMGARWELRIGRVGGAGPFAPPRHSGLRRARETPGAAKYAPWRHVARSMDDPAASTYPPARDPGKGGSSARRMGCRRKRAQPKGRRGNRRVDARRHYGRYTELGGWSTPAPQTYMWRDMPAARGISRRSRGLGDFVGFVAMSEIATRKKQRRFRLTIYSRRPPATRYQ